MHNKKLCKIEEVPRLAENLLLADEDNPGLEFKNTNLQRCLLIRLGMKEARVYDCIFLHCVFEDCYFRNVQFHNVDFTGSFLRDCNLHKASFEGCRFWYVRFSRCRIDYNEILQSIPSEPSIAIPVLKSLRQNAIEMGEKKAADKILKREIKAEKQELGNQFLAPSAYYKKRYKPFERCLSGLKFLTLVVSGWLWGHGLRLWNLLCIALVCILIFSLLICKFGSFTVAASSDVSVSLNIWQSLYLSAITFTTLGYGDFAPASTFGYFICAVESFLGIVFLGFLAATVYRKFSR